MSGETAVDAAANPFSEKNTPRPVPRLRDRRGEFTTGCAIWLFLMVVGAYVGYMFAVPFYEYSAFEGHISEMMPYYRARDANSIQRAVIDAAREYDLELKPEQVKVQSLRKDDRIIIDIVYTRDVELPFYTHTLTFRPHLTGSYF